MTVNELVEELRSLNPDGDDPVIIVIDEEADEDTCQELEPGSVLDIIEAGGWNGPARARTIRVKPR